MKYIINIEGAFYMYFIITREKSSGDIAVTNTYISTIHKAIEKTGEKCEVWNGIQRISRVHDYLIFDECKVAAQYILKGYKNIIVWIQGIVPEEAVMKGYAIYRYWVHSFLEYITLKRAKLIFLCSDEMKCHYEKKYHLNLEKKAFIMPCFNETSISDKAFSDFRKINEHNFVYIGSLSAWQCFEETLQVYKKIESSSKVKTYIYVYTYEKEKAFRLLKKYDIKNYVVDFLPSDQLGEVLGKFRYGFVLRRNHIVNRVATPTKLSNYIAHGIIPIYSDCLDSFNKYVQETKGRAIICNVENLDEGIDNICSDMMSPLDLNQLKEWCIYTFNSYYNQQRYCSQIAEFWKKIN